MTVAIALPPFLRQPPFTDFVLLLLRHHIHAVARLVVILWSDKVIHALKILQVGFVVHPAIGLEIGKLWRHADDEVFALLLIMVAHHFQRRRDHRTVVSRGNGRLLQVDIKTIKTIAIGQANNLRRKRFSLVFVQCNVRVSAAQ